MKKVDVLMLSVCRDIRSFRMTQHAISSLRSSTPDVDFNVVLVESNQDYRKYGFEFDATVVTPAERFNYNRFLNIGRQYCTASSRLVVSNNDVVFHRGWWEPIDAALETYASASPLCPGWGFHREFGGVEPIEGYRTGYEFCGWCLVWNTAAQEALFPMDEDFVYWCQDDDASKRLRKAGLRHALVPNSSVEHLVSQSARWIPPERRHEMYDEMGVLLARKWRTE